MEKIDVRKLEPAAREQLRCTMMRMPGRGHSQTAAAAELGINRLTVHNWAKAYAERGAAALKDGQRGRPQGVGRALTPAQEERVKKELIDLTPDQLKLKFVLWSAQAVRAAIKQMFLVDSPVRTVRKYLARWGFTPQRPVKRAYEQRPEVVEKWLKDTYPAIVSRAKAEGAEISWADETAASSVEHYARGYAPRGKTPVLVLSPGQSHRYVINPSSSARKASEVARSPTASPNRPKGSGGSVRW